MQVYISAISFGQCLHDLRLKGRVRKEEMGTPHIGRFFPDPLITFPRKTNIHSHVISTLIDTGNGIFLASAASCKGNGIANGNAQIRCHDAAFLS